MKIIMLGTGHGTATKCYNTCFLMTEDSKEYFLVDSGGGNGILKQLKSVNIKPEQIRNIFISHSHLDHILGCIWLIRVLSKKYFKKEIEKNLNIYGNDVTISSIKELCKLFIPKDFLNIFGDKIKFIELKNEEEHKILNHNIQFFDINAVKIKQYGFKMKLFNVSYFTFIGDESCSKNTEKYVKNTNWLFADAYMAGKDAEINNPIKNHHHSTVKFVCELCERLNVKNVILSHTMDNDIKNRKKKFIEDGKKYFAGRILVPDDLEEIYIEE